MFIYYERNNLYEAIIFEDIKSGVIYKTVLSTNGDVDISENFDNYLLPVGCIVELRNSSKLLIISRMVERNNRIVQYIGCDNIVGYRNDNEIEFEHTDIMRILSLAYEDESVVEETVRLKQHLDNKLISS